MAIAIIIIVLLFYILAIAKPIFVCVHVCMRMDVYIPAVILVAS